MLTSYFPLSARIVIIAMGEIHVLYCFVFCKEFFMGEITEKHAVLELT